MVLLTINKSFSKLTKDEIKFANSLPILIQRSEDGHTTSSITVDVHKTVSKDVQNIEAKSGFFSNLGTGIASFGNKVKDTVSAFSAVMKTSDDKGTTQDTQNADAKEIEQPPSPPSSKQPPKSITPPSPPSSKQPPKSSFTPPTPTSKQPPKSSSTPIVSDPINDVFIIKYVDNSNHFLISELGMRFHNTKDRPDYTQSSKTTFKNTNTSFITEDFCYRYLKKETKRMISNISLSSNFLTVDQKPPSGDAVVQKPITAKKPPASDALTTASTPPAATPAPKPAVKSIPPATVVKASTRYKLPLKNVNDFDATIVEMGRKVIVLADNWLTTQTILDTLGLHTKLTFNKGCALEIFLDNFQMDQNDISLVLEILLPLATTCKKTDNKDVQTPIYDCLLYKGYSNEIKAKLFLYWTAVSYIE